MKPAIQPNIWSIHRHTGGLEIGQQRLSMLSNIHRHTGGLENKKTAYKLMQAIHRHTGGLEITTQPRY